MPIDPSLPVDRIQFMLEDSKAKAIVNAVKSLSLKTDIAKVEVTSHLFLGDDRAKSQTGSKWRHVLSLHIRHDRTTQGSYVPGHECCKFSFMDAGNISIG